MGSFRENCEITEEKDEQRTSWQEHNNKPPFPKKGYNKSLEDDINKLFQSVNLRSSKSVDLSDARRNNSKRPMRAGSGTNSPGIRFSEPVSLKQALRGLCISQAAEMAAIKRMSLPASPRVSEAGKIRTTHNPDLAETGEPSCSAFNSRGQKIEILLVPEENSSTSSSRMVSSLIKPVVEKLEHNNSGDVGIAIDKCSTKRQPTESVLQNEIKRSPGIDMQLVSPTPHDNVSDNFPKQEQIISGSIEIKKPAPKLPRLKNASSVVKGNKDRKNSIKRTPRAFKPVIINKNLVIRKPKKAAMPKDLNRVQDDKSGPLICHKCQCSLMDTVEKDTPVVKAKPDISQKSSKSSVCEFSSSTTTSLSDESNLSGSTCGNSRPHMSKDARWEAINLVRKQYGFLGLNHFNLLKKLGSGDIGTVYLAELVGTGCLFAIKVMDNEFLGKRKKMGRAQTEREILRMLDHPFLPTLYAQFTSDNLSCLVMEFCPGGDLHVLRQKQPARYFPEYAARFYVAEVLLALEYLHMLGIVYRDLKPENILVREDGHIMLTDFDLSLRCSVSPTLVKSSSPAAIEPPRISGPCTESSCIDPFCSGPSCKMSCFSPRLLPSTAAARARKLKEAEYIAARSLPQLVAEPTEARSNSFVGTHEYLAPEIIKGEGHGSAVDWWTLGVFLYELLYGKTPFKGADNEDTLSNVVVRELRFPSTPIVSFQARDLIRGLLAKDPACRVGLETGAAEIKRHPFFEGLNWALIRSGSPPQVPEVCDVASLKMGFGEKGKGFLGCGGDRERLELELF